MPRKSRHWCSSTSPRPSDAVERLRGRQAGVPRSARARCAARERGLRSGEDRDHCARDRTEARRPRARLPDPQLGRTRVRSAEREYRVRVPGTRPVHIWEALWLAAHPPTVERRWKIVTSVRDPVARLVAQWFQDMLASGPGLYPLARSSTNWSRRRAARQRLVRLPVRSAPRHRRVSTSVRPGDGVRPHRDRRGGRVVGAAGEPGTVGVNAGRLLRVTQSRRLPPGERRGGQGLRVPVPRWLGQVRLPVELVDAVYSTRFARHFYSDAEIEAFRRRWT